jgi:hypothetical protein
MAKKRNPKVSTTKAAPTAKAVRLDLSPADHKRLDRHASALGLSMSSYARMAVLERMKADEAKGGTK